MKPHRRFRRVRAKAGVASVGAEFGGIDIAANVSAPSIGGGEESWAKCLSTDMTRMVRDAVMPFLLTIGKGSVVIIPSVSDREIDFITGTNLVIDGALTRGVQF